MAAMAAPPVTTEQLVAFLRRPQPDVAGLTLALRRRPPTAVVNGRTTIAGAPTCLLTVACGLGDASAALAAARVIVAAGGEVGAQPSCARCATSGVCDVGAMPAADAATSTRHVSGRDTFPLHAAAEAGHAAVVELLLRSGELCGPAIPSEAAAKRRGRTPIAV